MQIGKGKLCGRTIKVYQIQNKPNLNNIFKSYLGYCDLKGLRNSFNYFERLRKKIFIMIRQFGLLTFFVTLTFVKRLWDLFITVLDALYVLRLNLPNKIKDI